MARIRKSSLSERTAALKKPYGISLSIFVFLKMMVINIKYKELMKFVCMI
ncbi:MAG: hypothetical protein LBR30_04930 [Clostridioides sp.]|nr:hypothetical protein [Clostridioides sp.]